MLGPIFSFLDSCIPYSLSLLYTTGKNLICAINVHMLSNILEFLISDSSLLETEVGLLDD